MLKYGNIINVSNGNSKTLIPRNLIYHNVLNNSNTTTNTTTNTSDTTNETTQTSVNYESASITNLGVNNISVVSNTLTSNIVVSSPIAFSFLKSDYQSNNFNTYPIFFSEDILINNTKFILKSNQFTIKDNVILINSELTNTNINGTQIDNLISGFIFPIADQNISTGYYASLLYTPNNKIENINNVYNWTNEHYNYFTNQNKGFFKLKYLPQTLNFNNYNNTLDENYIDLTENNSNLANLQINALGVYDGEIVSMNNTNLSIKISDGTELYETINITKTDINILNNLSIKCVNNLVVKDENGVEFISIGELVTFYKSIVLNNDEHDINFQNTLNFNSGLNNVLKLTNDKCEFLVSTVITDLQILSVFELNNIPISFVNNLNIISNDNIFIAFDSLLNRIDIIQPTYINSLIINSTFNLNNNPLVFGTAAYFQDINNNRYIYLNGNTQTISLLKPTTIDTLLVNTSLNILNNTPINVVSELVIKNNTSTFIKFDANNTILYNNILFNTVNNPEINFPDNKTLKITNNSEIINLSIDSTITITGPTNSFQDISNTIVNSSFNVTNTSVSFFSLTFTPISKLYVLSGITTNNSIITFQCVSILNVNNMSGTLIGTTWSLANPFINAYNINLWSYPQNVNGSQIYSINYTTLNPINTTNNGAWYINRMYLTQPQNDGIYDLNIECVGLSNDQVIWGFKLDILQI
jgi:hypothetical protein